MMILPRAGMVWATPVDYKEMTANEGLDCQIGPFGLWARNMGIYRPRSGYWICIISPPFSSGEDDGGFILGQIILDWAFTRHHNC